MSQNILQASSSRLPVPMPREELSFRPANTGDIDDLDKLQKQFSKQLGFMPKSWLEGKIKANQILIAEVGGRVSSPAADCENEDGSWGQLPSSLVGYIIAQDHYLKRQELGIVYQLCVKPGKQRGFIGAALLKAQFDRSAPGCRLYCCWCAQDIEANHFWESMGFVPLAHRNGSEKKSRVHIFWEKKIRGNEDTCHWWYPCKTDAGAMGADRIALPIPPGVHWKDVQLIEIPVIGNEKLLEAPKEHQTRVVKPKVKVVRAPLTGGLRFAPVKPVESEPQIKERAKRAKKPKQKIDPKFISKSRELRDWYLEQVNEHGYRLESSGKYELTRGIGESESRGNAFSRLADSGARRLLEAA